MSDEIVQKKAELSAAIEMYLDADREARTGAERERESRKQLHASLLNGGHELSGTLYAALARRSGNQEALWAEVVRLAARFDKLSEELVELQRNAS